MATAFGRHESDANDPFFTARSTAPEYFNATTGLHDRKKTFPAFARAALLPSVVLTLLLSWGLPARAQCRADLDGTLSFHTEGRWIRDNFRRIALLRGANTPANYFYPFPYTTEDLDALRDLGFNFIRLGISWKDVEPEEGKYNLEHLEAYKNFIREAVKRGIYVMPEVHQVQWCVDGGFIPDWMCSTKYGHALRSDAIQKETDRFWKSEEMRGKLVKFWEFLTEQFMDVEGIFAFNLLNEPFSYDGLIYGKMEKCCLWPFYKEAVERIREIDESRVIAVEPTPFSSAMPTYVEPLGVTNVVYAPHAYFSHGYDDRGLVILDKESPKAARLKYLRYQKDADTMGAPLLIGEFGVADPESHAFMPPWFDMNLEMQDRLFLSSSVWDYNPNGGGWSIMNAGRTPRPFHLERLKRPWPRYTAGTPEKMRFDRETKTFRYRYQAGGACGPSEIYYPKGLFEAAQVKIEAPCEAVWSYREEKETLVVDVACTGAVELTVSPAK